MGVFIGGDSERVGDKWLVSICGWGRLVIFLREDIVFLVCNCNDDGNEYLWNIIRFLSLRNNYMDVVMINDDFGVRIERGKNVLLK